ncbi:MAG: class I SAM-dependent methyltransferase [Proteobacteria bacterium]|nr:class I SAM-dependent methyltransferase [Pseudomonadota bacterium]
MLTSNKIFQSLKRTLKGQASGEQFDQSLHERLIASRPPTITERDWKKKITFLEGLLSKVEGWFSPKQCGELFLQIISNVKSGSNIVEIGSWKGRSSIFASHAASICQSQLYCVDTWRGNEGEGINHSTVLQAAKQDIFKEFERNIERYGCKNVIVCKGNSSDIAAQWKTGAIDFLFIDGSHDYESVLKDLNAWIPHLKKGGIVCGDDWNYDELPDLKGSVRKAFQDFFGVNQPNLGIVERFWIHEVG